MKIYCNVCKEEVEAIRLHSMKYGFFYKCPGCGALVGCHPNTDKPLGTFPTEEMKAYRRKCHDMFDPIWIRYPNKKQARGDLYQALAKHLGIKQEECHFGMLSLDNLRKALKWITYYRSIEDFEQEEVLAKERDLR